MATFLDLFDGEVDHLKIAIVVFATRASRKEPNAGVWQLNRQQLIAILDSIVSKRRFADRGQVLDALDANGPESRFFRMNTAVAEWIDNNEPEVLDYVVL